MPEFCAAGLFDASEWIHMQWSHSEKKILNSRKIGTCRKIVEDGCRDG